jgi:hypothetical protein
MGGAGYDMASLFGLDPPVRISNYANPDMIISRLQQVGP